MTELETPGREHWSETRLEQEQPVPWDQSVRVYQMELGEAAQILDIEAAATYWRKARRRRWDLVVMPGQMLLAIEHSSPPAAAASSAATGQPPADTGRVREE